MTAHEAIGFGIAFLTFAIGVLVIAIAALIWRERR